MRKWIYGEIVDWTSKKDVNLYHLDINYHVVY